MQQATAFRDGKPCQTGRTVSAPAFDKSDLSDMSQMDQEVNVLALVKGEEKYIFLFDDANRDETLRQLARFAADPELEFSWYDAAMLSRKIRDAVPSEEDALASDEFDSLSIDDFH